MKTKIPLFCLFVLVPFFVFSQNNFLNPRAGNPANHKSTKWNISQQLKDDTGVHFKKPDDKDAVQANNSSSALASQGNDSLLLVGRWAYGPSKTVTYSNNTIYYSVGSYLVIADVSNPDQPVELSKVLLPSPAKDIFPYGNFVFIADGSFGLQIIDVTHPKSPAIISSLALFDNRLASHIAVSGHYAYIADNHYIHVIDINNLSNPEEVYYFSNNSHIYAAGFAIHGNYLYLVAPFSGLSVFDITNPLHPKEVGYVDIPTTEFTTNAVISGKYVYVTIRDGIQVVDVSNAESPKKVSVFNTKGTPGHLWVDGDKIFIAEGWQGTQVVDVGDPDSLNEIGSFNNDDFMPSFGIAVNKNVVYVGHGDNGLEVVDISNINAPKKIKDLNPYYSTKDVFINGFYAYLLQGHVTILDISNPHNPKKIGWFGDKVYPQSAALYKQYFYVGGGNIYDVSNPVSPVKVGHINIPYASDMTISGNRLFVANDNYGLKIFDLNNPATPLLLSSYKTGKDFMSVVSVGDYAYISDVTTVHILNVKNPAAPFEVGFIKKDVVFGISFHGHFLYIAGDRGTYIYDMSNPSSPKYVSLIYTHTNLITFFQHYGLLAGGNSDSLFIFNLTNPSSPKKVGEFFIGSRIMNKIIKEGDMVYIAGEDGLHILQLKTRDTRFYPVWLGKPYTPMKILIDSVLYANMPLKGGDEVGIFVEDSSGTERCVGMKKINYPDSISSAHPLKIIVSQDDTTTKTINGFIPGHQIIFKLWSSDEKQVYSFYNAAFNPIYDTTFTPSGTAKLNLSFQPDVVQTNHLDAGWNMVSFYVTPNSLNMYQVMKSLITSQHLIKVIDEKGGFLQNIPRAGWINTIGNMDDTKGYYLKVSSNVSLNTKGHLVRLPVTMLLRSGWNIMGYPFHFAQSAYKVFKNLILTSDLVKVMNEAGEFIQYFPRAGWLYTFSDLVPGKGYYIHVKNNTDLIIDKGMKISSVSFPITSDSLHTTSHYFNKAYKNDPYYPMNIVITDIDLDGYQVHPGDEIAVFDKNVCVGFTTIPEDDTLPLSIVASADDPETRIQDGFVTGDPITIRFMSDYLESPVVMHTDQKFGTESFSPLETFACRISASAEQLKKHLKSKAYNLQIYPNPAFSSTTLNLFSSEKTKVKIDVVNMDGEIVKTVTNRTIPAGNTQFKVNTLGLSSGIYNVRVILHTKGDIAVKNYKLVIVK